MGGLSSSPNDHLLPGVAVHDRDLAAGVVAQLRTRSTCFGAR